MFRFHSTQVRFVVLRVFYYGATLPGFGDSVKGTRMLGRKADAKFEAADGMSGELTGGVFPKDEVELFEGKETSFRDETVKNGNRSSSVSSQSLKEDAKPVASELGSAIDAPKSNALDCKESDDPAWSPYFECYANDVVIDAGDVADDPDTDTQSYQRSQVATEMQPHSTLQQRLSIISLSLKPAAAEIFWLPLTRVGVKTTGSCINVRFSNCKQKVKESVNHHDSYSLVYDATRPNVKLQVTCSNESEALRLSELLLQNKRHLITEMNEKQYEFSLCTIKNGSAGSPDRGSIKGFFVWYVSSTYDLFDMAFFTDRLDFELENCEGDTHLRLYLLSKLEYEPEDVGISTYWPPPEVQANKDGHLSCAKLSTNPTRDELTTLVVMRDELINFMNATIGFATSSVLLGWYEVEFAPPSHKRISIVSKKPSQLTVWKRDANLSCLVRYGDHDSQSYDQQWSSWLLAKSEEGNETRPRLQLSKTQALLKDLQVRSGDRLSLRADSFFEARWSEEAGERPQLKKADTKIHIHTDGDLEAFQRVVADHVEIG